MLQTCHSYSGPHHREKARYFEHKKFKDKFILVQNLWNSCTIFSLYAFCCFLKTFYTTPSRCFSKNKLKKKVKTGWGALLEAQWIKSLLFETPHPVLGYRLKADPWHPATGHGRKIMTAVLVPPSPKQEILMKFQVPGFHSSLVWACEPLVNKQKKDLLLCLSNTVNSEFPS